MPDVAACRRYRPVPTNADNAHYVILREREEARPTSTLSRPQPSPLTQPSCSLRGACQPVPPADHVLREPHVPRPTRDPPRTRSFRAHHLRHHIGGLPHFFLASLAIGLAHLYRAGIDGWNSGSVAITDASNENLSASRLSDEQLSAAKELAQEHGTTASTLMSTAAVAQVPEVKDKDGKALRDDVFAFGIDLDGELSPVVTSGRSISDPTREILVDDSLEAKGFKTGDTLRLLGSDHDWTIVGLTHDTTFQSAPVVTLDGQALSQYGPTSLSPAVSAIVFKADLTTDSKAMQSAQDAGLTILTSEELVRTLPGYSAQVLTFSLMIGSLILIASTVLGIFIYVLTLQKRPVLGILKARGVPTGYLVRSGCAQTLVLSVVGIGIGLLLTVATSLVLPSAVPFRLSGLLDLLIAAAFVLVSVIGGLISVRVVSRIDPVEAIS